MLIDKMKMEISRFTWKVPNDFGVASTSHIVNIPIWGTDYVVGIFGRIVTAFAGITGPVTMQMGTSADTECVMKAQRLDIAEEIFVGIPSASWYCTLLGPQTRKYGKYDMNAPLVTFTSASGNLEDLTAGEVELIVIHVVPEK